MNGRETFMEEAEWYGRRKPNVMGGGSRMLWDRKGGQLIGTPHCVTNYTITPHCVTEKDNHTTLCDWQRTILNYSIAPHRVTEKDNHTTPCDWQRTILKLYYHTTPCDRKRQSHHTVWLTKDILKLYFHTTLCDKKKPITWRWIFLDITLYNHVVYTKRRQSLCWECKQFNGFNWTRGIKLLFN